ncbi:LiaI-LiaF-like domain-containing protein [Massilia sp. Se16.2.3]|uniref:LiaI-LiaF-like domain-containing protein n=1 Tax=Massilia sp. Se16.2.3 TaxID=2709303 RepID=UPI0016024351|nr:DUF5668 domain-containing protein [Massilia sp. Se16.2.3]QNB00077.1 hypothetical protein G4G31_16715 [Massilia sp. Se16.2.3]
MERIARWERGAPGLLVALAAIVVGSVALARDTGLFDAATVQQWWPLALVMAGVILLFGRVVHD